MPQLDAKPAEIVQTPKKAYQAPTLHRYGTASELTQTNAPAQDTPQNDGGTFPNNYGS